MLLPEQDDVVVREEPGSSAVYLLGTAAAPGQFIVHTREDAVARARRYAELKHVSAWYDKDGEPIVLLASFRPAFL